MHLPTTTAFLALLTISALAHPSPLQKRGLGSIAGFWDHECYGAPVPGLNVPARPENPAVETCIPFNTPATFIGINWGDPTHRAHSLIAFTDTSCKDYLTKAIPDSLSGDYWDGDTRKVLGTNSCVKQADYGGGAMWQSVMYFPTRDGKDLGEVL